LQAESASEQLLQLDGLGAHAEIPAHEAAASEHALHQSLERRRRNGDGITASQLCVQHPDETTLYVRQRPARQTWQERDVGAHIGVDEAALRRSPRCAYRANGAEAGDWTWRAGAADRKHQVARSHSRGRGALDGRERNVRYAKQRDPDRGIAPEQSRCVLGAVRGCDGQVVVALDRVRSRHDPIVAPHKAARGHAPPTVHCDHGSTHTLDGVGKIVGQPGQQAGLRFRCGHVPGIGPTELGRHRRNG
jgi:hypothetical protein